MTTTTTEIVLPGLVEPDGLRVEHRELPRPGAGEALVRVEASGVSFAEQQMRRGKYYDQPPFPFVPGYDVVGTVLEAGDPALVGQRVAAMTKIGGGGRPPGPRSAGGAAPSSARPRPSSRCRPRWTPPTPRRSWSTASRHTRC